MESIKININNPHRAYRDFSPQEITEVDNELLIKLSNKECYAINNGDTLYFRRLVTTEDGNSTYITSPIKVISEDENHIIHTEKIRPTLLEIAETERICGTTVSEEDGSVITYDYLMITTTKDHNLFSQDVLMGQSIDLMDDRWNVIASFNDVKIPNKYTQLPSTTDDNIIMEESITGCNYCRNNKVLRKYYSFAPLCVSRTKILVPYIDDEATIWQAKYISTRFNPFYYYTEEEKSSERSDIKDNKIKHCYLYKDLGWDDCEIRKSKCEKYVRCGTTRTFLSIEDSFWNVGLALAADANEQSLGSDDSFSDSLVYDIEESIIPDVIDMERIKYSPIISGNNIMEIATSITIDLHFRKRVENTPEDSPNTKLTKNNPYIDGWYIDLDNEPTIWWNGVNSTDSALTPQIITNIDTMINSPLAKSDSLKCLNFTDDDIYYRKKKISKSFIRLSFYTSTDPIEQKLLYYSTVFFDGGKLYGEYIKCKNDRSNNEPCNDQIYSQFVITNEFDRTSSAEGFNIYLFNSDAGNYPKTIYMKVEFNHAGVGKTIPMLMWPKVDDMYVPLTIENYLQSLYIPVEISCVNGKYVYKIPGAINANSNIKLVLFEPKLDQIND